MMIDEEKIREAAEDESGKKLKEACVRTYCEVLDAIRLLEEQPDRVVFVAVCLHRDHYDQIAEKYLPKLWARYKELERSIVEKQNQELERRKAEKAKLPWWKRWTI